MPKALYFQFITWGVQQSCCRRMPSDVVPVDVCRQLGPDGFFRNRTVGFLTPFLQVLCPLTLELSHHIVLGKLLEHKTPKFNITQTIFECFSQYKGTISLFGLPRRSGVSRKDPVRRYFEQQQCMRYWRGLAEVA